MKDMKILITSGGTSEAIDRVRSITNHSTGRLGSLLANYFAQKEDEVTLVTTKRAIQADQHDNISTFFIKNVQDLAETLENLVTKHDVIIHAMAVSDYTPVYMADLDQFKKETDLTSFLSKENSQGKISSKADYQVLFLKKNPKIISLIKQWNPDISLIGFKLLVDVSKEELLTVAKESLVKNQAGMIVANDLLGISKNQHQAYLVQQDHVEKVASKQEIAERLYAYVHRKEEL